MAGANYMGGRRNSAKAKTKDVTGRTQKGHFMRQKHQILARGLRNCSFDDSKEQRGGQSERIKEISFAHAKKDMQREENRQAPKAPTQSRTSVRYLPPSSSPRSVNERQLRNSKILEDLDINEPSGLKATLRRILRQPDLAGLSHINLKSSISRQPNDSPRKRRRTYEQTSSNSPSSSRYDSSTRKEVTDEPRLLVKNQYSHSHSASTGGQSSSNAHISARSSSVLAEKSDTGNTSLGSSLDRVSVIRDMSLKSSYSDSGFSELQFSDQSKELQLDETQTSKESRNLEGGASSKLLFPISNDTRREAMHKDWESQSSQVAASLSPSCPLKSWEMSSQRHPALAFLQSHNDLAFHVTASPTPDESIKSSSQAEPKLGGDADHISDACEYQRYGVGYVPTNFDVKYKPFVPLTTMLPSYSDEDPTNIDGHDDVDVDVAFMRDELMEVDELLDNNELRDEEPLILPVDEPITLPLSAPSSSYTPTRTPPRRFVSSPVHSVSAVQRRRFSFPTKQAISSVLRANSGRSHVSLCSQDDTSSERHGFTSPSAILKALPPIPPHTHRASGGRYAGRELRRITEVPQYQLPGPPNEDSSQAPMAQGFSVNAPAPDEVQTDSTVASAHVKPVPSTAGSDGRHERSAAHLASCMISTDYPDVCLPAVLVDMGGHNAAPIMNDTERAHSPEVFDGPDLFGGDADDADDD